MLFPRNARIAARRADGAVTPPQWETPVDELAAIRVLVVAGHGDLAARVGELLRAVARGTEVVIEEATSLTDAAWRLVGRPTTDVVLMDLDLSDVSPAAGVAVLAGVPAAPPVIAIATLVADAWSTDDVVRAVIAAGASDVVDHSDLGQPDRLWRSILITIERHARRLQMEEQSTQLLRATTQLAHLASRLRHDLKSPLAVALAALDTLPQPELDEPTREGLLTMARERLRDLASRLDDLAGALSAGELSDEASREELALRDLVAEVRSDLAPWDRERLDLEVEGEERVWAAHRLLRGLLGGLVRNALQHNPDVRVTVRVRLGVEDGCAELLVADDGVGIDHDLRDAVFDVGWTTLDPPSLGVGLPAASSAVAMMEGSIRAVDSPLGGAAFRVVFPQRPVAVAAR